MAIGHRVREALEAKAAQETEDMSEQDTPQTPAIDPALAQMIALTVAAAMRPVVDAIGSLVAGQHEAAAEAIKAAKQPRRPESYKGDFPYHERSHFRPDGIDGPPLPMLRCESFLGYWEENELTGHLEILPGYPYIADEYGGCTLEERQLLNALEAGVYRATRRDGGTGIVRVQIRHDTDGTPFRMVIAVPKMWLTKTMKNMIGGVEFLRQLHPDVAVRVTHQTPAA